MQPAEATREPEGEENGQLRCLLCKVELGALAVVVLAAFALLVIVELAHGCGQRFAELREVEQ